MRILFLLLLSQVVPDTFEYEVRCPVSAEWHFRARKLNCSSSSYVCLFHSLKNIYHETCDGLDYSSRGSKLIFEPFFNKAECSNKRYQPFPFSTNGSSNCVYQKSVCNGDGQFVFHKGISKNDTTCGCNFSNGYTFITKPRHTCYCIPSEEDCSCYKVSCNVKENQCHHDDAAHLNLTCPEIITKFSHEHIMSTPMELDRLQGKQMGPYYENKGRNDPIQWICLTTILLTSICISVLLYVMINNQELQGMETSEKNRYMKAIQLGYEVRRYVRIIVIGENGAGKTTLVRRLLGQDIGDIDSTDGIEMNNKFQIRQSDGQWIFNKAETEFESITKRIRQTTERNPEEFASTKKPGSIEEYLNPSVRNSNGQEPITSKPSDDKSEQTDANTDQDDHIITGNTYEEIRNTDTNISYDEKPDERLQYHAPPRTDQTLNNMDTANESDIEIDAILLRAKNMKASMISEGLIQCGIWDFAGEKDYYVTHQTFLTPDAIYLIVADVNKDMIEEEKYFDSIGVADVNKDIKTLDMIEEEKYFDSIGGYIDFWFDSVHCFCEDNLTDENMKNPPILMIATHTDKCVGITNVTEACYFRKKPVKV